MSALGKLSNIVRQSASKTVNSQAIRCMAYAPSSKSFIGGIPSQSDAQAMDSKELLNRRVRIDDTIYRRGFGGIGVGCYGARSYSAGAAVGAAGVTSNTALANVAGGGLLNLTLFWHINDGIREILADYVHHEMTRTVMLVNLRLFLLIAAKDVFVSFAL